jgi:HSP20 family molecular chaperone IbpA
MGIELTPAEEAAARIKEAEEQAALPYKWTQTISELDITFSVPGNFKGKDLSIDIKKTKLVAGTKGQEPIISVSRALTLVHRSFIRRRKLPRPLTHRPVG